MNDYYYRGIGVRKGKTMRNADRLLWNSPKKIKNVIKRKLEKKQRKRSRSKNK